MQLVTLRERLLSTLRAKVKNGQITERGLARSVGLSQPHIHNVLKGARILSPEVADCILKHLGMSILDCLDEADLRAFAAQNQDAEHSRLLTSLRALLLETSPARYGYGIEPDPPDRTDQTDPIED